MRQFEPFEVAVPRHRCPDGDYQHKTIDYPVLYLSNSGSARKVPQPLPMPDDLSALQAAQFAGHWLVSEVFLDDVIVYRFPSPHQSPQSLETKKISIQTVPLSGAGAADEEAHRTLPSFASGDLMRLGLCRQGVI
jgi:hypothetical protein